MTLTHWIALDPNDQQETLLRQHAGWARFAWNWGMAESRRSLDAGEKSVTSHYRLGPAFNRVKRDGIRWHAAVICEITAPEPKGSGVATGVDVELRRLGMAQRRGRSRTRSR